MEFIV